MKRLTPEKEYRLLLQCDWPIEKIQEAMKKMLAKNKEYIAAYKESHKVEAKGKKGKEEQITLGGYDEE